MTTLNSTTGSYTANYLNGQWEIRNQRGQLVLTARTQAKAHELVDLMNRGAE